MSGRIQRCKSYHDSTSAADAGLARRKGDRKSRCPGWAHDAAFRQRLLDEAIVDRDAGEDAFGNPKRLWNAVAHWYFVAVSTNEQSASYNCYPEEPLAFLEELAERAHRTVEEVLAPPPA